MKRKLRNNKKGMSIVISTVIIVAISITMAIAVAFWAMGIGNSFTKFEKLEFVSIYADTPINVGGVQAYPIYLTLKNTGTGAANINNVFLNGKPWNVPSVNANVNFISQTLAVGQRSASYPSGGYWRIYLPVGGTWNSGDYVEVEIETTAGRLYSNTVALP
jgi:archaeal type IV pilus assembly protein PilA